MQDNDHLVRLAAFEWLRAQVDVRGESLPRSLLAQGFQLHGDRVPLLGPQGIFKPRVMREAPLSITTVSSGPYSDSFESGILRYAYRGTDPDHPDNRGLRLAMSKHLPLVYFYGTAPGKYLPVWPVYVVGDRRQDLFFDIVVDDAQYLTENDAVLDAIAEDRAAIRRGYITAVVKRRLHQKAFRSRVLEAYREQCALCRLRHEELLDAAHITKDADPEGEPVVSNGLSLCKLHHAAFDEHFLTVRPDFRVEVRKSILDEEDGPMLQHGLKGMHLQLIVLPRSPNLQPDRDRLQERYAVFSSLQ
jgi:putative restriction endonuclease